jgi:hypothetical protein
MNKKLEIFYSFHIRSTHQQQKSGEIKSPIGLFDASLSTGKRGIEVRNILLDFNLTYGKKEIAVDSEGRFLGH